MQGESNPTTTPTISPYKLGIGLAVLGALAFSIKPVLLKLLLNQGIEPATLMTLRMAFALPIFLVVGYWSMRKQSAPLKSNRGAIIRAMFIGVLGYYIAALLDLLGLQYITAQFERMILFLYPTFVCVLGALFFGETFTRRLLVALPLSYTGVVLIFLHDFSHFGEDAVTGGLLVLGGALCFAGYMLFSKACIRQIGAAAFTSIAMGTASVFILVHFLVTQDISDLYVSNEVLLIAFLIAVVATTAPSFLISAAVARIGTSRTSIATSIGPISTALFAVAILGEAFTLNHAIGMALTLGGVLYLAREA
ncbi:MAG: DMT family transporter [Pseudomonadota bacterium]